MIARADGSVLYNFAVAIDDLDAEISHVVRGADHLSNTPKQLLVLEALGAPSPRLRPPAAAARSRRPQALQAPRRRVGPGAARRRLPARGRRQLHRAARRRLRRRRGVLHAAASWPTASGWSGCPRARRCSTRRSCAASNGDYLRALGVDELTRRLETFTGRTGLRDAVEISAEKIQTLADFWPLVSFLFDGPVDDPAAFDRVIGSDGGVDTLRDARAALAAVRAVRRRDGSGGAARRRRAARRQARQGVSAGPRGDRRPRRFRRGSSSRSRCSGREQTLAPDRRRARPRRRAGGRLPEIADRQDAEPTRR